VISRQRAVVEHEVQIYTQARPAPPSSPPGAYC
jgi:hypothetical protein